MALFRRASANGVLADVDLSVSKAPTATSGADGDGETRPAAPAVVASGTHAEARKGPVAAGLALVALGAALGWAIYQGTDPADFVPKSDYSAFAALFILAAALERVLEPFTPFVPPDTASTKKELENAVAQAKSPGATDAHMVQAAGQQDRLDRERTERGFILWGLASMLAMVACASLGVFMLRSVADVPKCDPKAATCTVNDPNRFVDLVTTGLVVGTGTKPLHDLVTRMQIKKEKEQDPVETKS